MQPAAHDPPSYAAPAAAEPTPPVGHVLVVDDEPSLCDVLQLGLERRAMRVTTCRDGEQALALVARGGFDVVLTDIQMPGMDGVELCRRIAARRADLPVIMMTGFGSFESAVAALRAGAYDFVTKPIETDLLWFALRRARRRARLR